MKYTVWKTILLLIGFAFAASASANDEAALRFLCFEDGNECGVYADLLSRFSQANPGIAVSVDVVAAQDIDDRLYAAIDADAGPDFARVADLDAFAGHYLDLRPLLADAESFAARFPALALHAMSGVDDNGIYGYPDAAAVVAPFVNASAFADAGVDLPGDDATWDEWLLALAAVVAATDAQYALSVDNKDHRLVGPAMSLGARYFEADRLTLPDDDGLRDWLLLLHGLMDAGETPADTLLGTGKSQAYFVRGETLMYICGSWKVAEVAAQVGDAFEWTIVPNPAGPGGATGVAKLTALAAMAGTAHPAAVAQVFDYLSQPDIIAEFAARTLTIPASPDALAEPIDYDADNAIIAEALNDFAREFRSMQPDALALDLHPLASAYYAASNAWLRGYFAGDWTLDEALAGLKAALADAADASGG